MEIRRYGAGSPQIVRRLNATGGGITAGGGVGGGGGFPRPRPPARPVGSAAAAAAIGVDSAFPKLAQVQMAPVGTPPVATSGAAHSVRATATAC